MDDILPVDKRNFRLFISHSSKDKEVVSRIASWLSDIAGIRVWYDSDMIEGGDDFITNLERGIPASRGLLLIHSQNSVKSKWVKQEVQAAQNHEVEYSRFRIIIICIDNTPLDGFLALRQQIIMKDGVLTLETCRKLLRALYPGNVEDENRDIYASVGWHENEQALIRYVAQHFINAQYRLIGDAEDQKKFTSKGDRDIIHERYKDMSNDQRIKNIISSCGGFLAVMPYRDAAENEPYGFTSKYILREVDWALEIGVPVIIIKDDRVILPDKILKSSIHVADISLSDGLKEPKSPIVLAALENMNEHFLRTLISDHYAFFASDINPDNAVRNKAIREIIQRVSAMPCRFGERIHTQGNLYGIIIERIRNSFMMIADITDQRVNIMIEAGIAIGAKVPIYYVQYSEKEEAKHRPPVMLGTIEPSKYKDEVELIGIIHRLAYPYRRRVLNSEIGGR